MVIFIAGMHSNIDAKDQESLSFSTLSWYLEVEGQNYCHSPWKKMVYDIVLPFSIFNLNVIFTLKNDMLLER